MKKIAILLVMVLFAGLQVMWAQSTITGTVKDAEGAALPGATVRAQGFSGVGTVTDMDGRYSLQVPEGATTLVYSFVGMKENVQTINGRTTIDVTLAPADVTVDEVVVVAYGTSTKGTYTGSAGVVKSKELEKRQVSNVSNALAGVVAGVQIQSNNGQPGESAKIKVRGVGSINAGSDPLYVLDGIPFDGDIASINPSDIASLTVLKDAASTALYGARGANGIIMITTKKGHNGEASINFGARIGVNSRGVQNYDVLTSPKNYTELAYQSLYNAGIYNLGQTPVQANAYANSTLITDGNGGYGYQIFTVPDGELLVGTTGKINPNATLGYFDGDYYYTPDNWADEMFQNNTRQEYNLTVSGGNNTSDYYISLGYLDDMGVISNSAYNRISSRFKANNEINKWLKVGTNVSYNITKSNYPGEQTTTTSSGNAFFVANYIAPVYPLYVRDSTKNVMMNNGRKVYDYGDGVSSNFDRSFMAIANPAGDLIYNKDDYNSGIMNASAYAELTPLKGLKLTAKYGLNVDNTQYHSLGNAYMGQSAAYGGFIYDSQRLKSGFDQQYTLFYQNKFGESNIDFTGGYDGYSYSYEKLWSNGNNLYNPESYYMSNAIDNKTTGGYKDIYVSQGLFGRLNYSYKNTYIANVAYRRDASSRFSPDNRWGNFWSASAAWVLSNESFLSSLTWVNLFKLKASYGQQGNDAIGNYYAWLDQYNMTGAEGVFSDGVLSYKGNADLTWETSTSYNTGVDFKLFNNRLYGSVEYFGRQSTDMLYYKPVAGSVGYNSIPMNIGSMTNSGVEIDLGWNLIKTKNFNWSIQANATLVKNKINKLHPDLKGKLIDGTRIYEEGESMYRMYLVEYAGVDSKTGEAQYWTEDTASGTRVKTVDYLVASDHKIATEDLLPKVYGGFGTSLSAFGFDASVQASYQLGGKIYDSGYARLMHGGTSSYAGNNWHKDIYNAWTPENTNTDVPRLDASDKFANRTSTRFLTSSDYLSLDNISVGYTVPSNLLSRIKISNLRIYFAADHLYLLSSRKGLDPRQSYISATTARYTSIRTISGGINVTF